MSLNFKGHREWAEHLSVIMQIGLTMAGCIVFCFFVGRYLDRLFETKGIFLIIFTILGIAGGANVTYRQIMEVIDKGKKTKGPEDDKRG
jgi:ATP synthase protein I